MNSILYFHNYRTYFEQNLDKKMLRKSQSSRNSKALRPRFKSLDFETVHEEPVIGKSWTNSNDSVLKNSDSKVARKWKTHSLTENLKKNIT